ncbi:MAG TPA: SGNH/GDSL hydrolase family protein [Pseudonocardiaceae bacterium]
MRSGKNWRLLCASVALAIATPVLASSGSSVAQENGPDGGPAPEWVGSWATALTGAEPTGVSRTGFTNQSVRMIVRVSVGGEQVRIRLANVYGEGAVTIGSASVAMPNLGTPAVHDIVPDTLRGLTFGGSASATMLRGQELLSDPVDLEVADLQQLTVTVFFPVASGPASWHVTSRQSSFTGPGDLTMSPGTGYTAARTCCWFFLSGVDVLRRKSEGSVVVLSDSMGDGNNTTLNANRRWPDRLAERLVEARRNGKVPGVLNASLAGNRLNHEGPEPGAGGFPGFAQLGTNAAARLHEDVFSQTGVHTVIFDLGINDIWMNGDQADAIIASIRQAGAQVRERGVRFVVATLGPYEGFAVTPGSPAGEWTPEKEATRNAVNEFLRTSTEFDGLIDFDALLRDPANPSRLRADFDSGDHIHPNDAGNQAMADLVPLYLLRD